MNSKLFTVLISSAVSILIFIASQSILSKKENEINIKSELSNRPTYDYVNKQDENLRNTLILHIEESRKTDETLMNYIKSMDGKIDILLRSRR